MSDFKSTQSIPSQDREHSSLEDQAFLEDELEGFTLVEYHSVQTEDEASSAQTDDEASSAQTDDEASSAQTDDEAWEIKYRKLVEKHKAEIAAVTERYETECYQLKEKTKENIKLFDLDRKNLKFGLMAELSEVQYRLKDTQDELIATQDALDSKLKDLKAERDVHEQELKDLQLKLEYSQHQVLQALEEKEELHSQLKDMKFVKGNLVIACDQSTRMIHELKSDIQHYRKTSEEKDETIKTLVIQKESLTKKISQLECEFHEMEHELDRFKQQSSNSLVEELKKQLEFNAKIIEDQDHRIKSFVDREKNMIVLHQNQLKEILSQNIESENRLKETSKIAQIQKEKLQKEIWDLGKEIISIRFSTNETLLAKNQEIEILEDALHNRDSAHEKLLSAYNQISAAYRQKEHDYQNLRKILDSNEAAYQSLSQKFHAQSHELERVQGALLWNTFPCNRCEFLEEEMKIKQKEADQEKLQIIIKLNREKSQLFARVRKGQKKIRKLERAYWK